MSVFKRFGPGDQIDNVLVLEPTWTLVSGSSGWRGSPEGSASVSLYGGYNRAPGGVVREYRFQRTIQGTDSFGVLARSEPITASAEFVYMTKEERPIFQRSSTRWGYEHWKTIMRLYDHYSRRDPDYVTSSYDHYSLYFQRDSRNVVSLRVSANGSPHYAPTGSFTLETWAKPFQTTSEIQDFTIQNYNSYFWFGITGSNGTLAFSSSLGLFTSSIGPTPGRWHHTAVSFNASSLTGTFYLDLQNVGNFVLPSALSSSDIAGVRKWTVGNVISASNAVAGDLHTDVGSLRRSFHGFIGDTRFWKASRTWSEISSSHSHRLSREQLSGSSAPLAYLALNDGPLSVFRWPAALSIPTVAGSGALNSTEFGDYANGFARLMSFNDRSGPVWHPSDNVEFYPPKQFVRGITSGSFEAGSSAAPSRSEDVQRMLVLTVPAGMAGRRITPNSVSLTDRAYSSGSFGLVRTLIDDGRGGLFLSGTAVSSSLNVATGVTSPEESYRGVEWTKVGNVFYDEGLVVIKDPALLDFAAPWTAASVHRDDLLQFSFRGDSRIPVKTLMCRIDRGDINASLNQTFWEAEEDGDRIRRHPSGSIYVSSVGIYNSDRELVGIARLAEPLRVRPRDRMNIKLRMDF